MGTRASSAAAALAGMLLLTGCGGSPGIADRSYSGLPDTPGESEGIPLPGDAPRGTWIELGKSFAITTWGSSSCPSVPTSIEVTADDAVTVHFEPSNQDPCTADMAPTTHEFTTPAGSSAVPLTITLTYASWDGTNTIVLD